MATADTETRDRVRTLLQSHGITPTAQRLRVGQVLFACDQHLTADEVLARLRVAGARVSKATVYNTLNLFAARGLVRHLNVEASHASFDSNIRPHFHFHVVDTGELIDVPPGDVEFASLPEPPRGTEIAGVDVVLRLRRNG